LANNNDYILNYKPKFNEVIGIRQPCYLELSTIYPTSFLTQFIPFSNKIPSAPYTNPRKFHISLQITDKEGIPNDILTHCGQTHFAISSHCFAVIRLLSKRCGQKVNSVFM